MAKFKNCKNLKDTCFEHENTFDLEKYKPTNADRIRNMTDEELAKALIFYDSDYEGYSHVFEPYITHPVKEEVEKMCLEWLKSEVGCE